MFGLIANFLFGIVLIGPFGIMGVVISTLIGNAVVLAGVLFVSIRHGLKIDVGIYVIALALLAVCLGKWFTFLAVVTLIPVAILTPLVFDAKQKKWVNSKILSYRDRVLGFVQ